MFAPLLNKLFLSHLCLQPSFEWEKPSYTDGEGERIIFSTEGNKSYCRIGTVQIQDEGDWRCHILDKPDGESKEETLCSLVVYGTQC